MPGRGRRILAAIGLAGLGVIGGAAASLARAIDCVLYNASASVPPGLYQRIDAPATEGAFVTVRARDVAADYAAARAFTDDGDRFIKRVVAVKGREVCARGLTITIDGVAAARRAGHDGAGRALPGWEGCRVLSDGEVFLLGDTSDSFDGRYWGPVSEHLIEGVWRPLSVPK